jgi:dolichyl-phosphate-mannose-protein mannosyltransferase
MGAREQASVIVSSSKLVAPEAGADSTVDRASPRADVPGWSRFDTLVVAGLVMIAALTRLWRLGHPAAVVFDEIYFVGQGGAYLRGEQFMDPHPPLAAELMGLSMWLFGTSQQWAWRLPNASVGIALVAITYALGRRMFESRLTGALAAGFVIFDGAFLVDSRTGVPDIVYISLAALSYLLLFRFTQSSNPCEGRRTLLMLGSALGLCLGGKLLLPEVAALIVIGFLLHALASRWPALDQNAGDARRRLILGSLLLVGSTAALWYVAVFVPNYIFLGWRGIQALLQYFRDAIWFEQTVTEVPDLRASPWWSWPLMLHPFVYWNETLDASQIATIWFGGNPVLWWGALSAIAIFCVRLVSRPNAATAFVVIGYFAYLLILSPISRTMYLYHFMPAAFLAMLALAKVVSDCWRGAARRWEQALLLAALIPALGLALGDTRAPYAIVAMAAACGLMLWRLKDAGKPVCVSFLASALAAFVYFLPIWYGLPIARASFDARMWLHQPGVADWTRDSR